MFHFKFMVIWNDVMNGNSNDLFFNYKPNVLKFFWY